MHRPALFLPVTTRYSLIYIVIIFCWAWVARFKWKFDSHAVLRRSHAA